MGELLCRTALERLTEASRWHSFYKGLAAGVAIVVVLTGVFLAWAVTQDPASGEAIAGYFVAVFSVGGLGWISLQFRNARKDQLHWWHEVEEHCADPDIDAIAGTAARLSRAAIDAIYPVPERSGGDDDTGVTKTAPNDAMDLEASYKQSGREDIDGEPAEA